MKRTAPPSLGPAFQNPLRKNEVATRTYPQNRRILEWTKKKVCLTRERSDTASQERQTTSRRASCAVVLGNLVNLAVRLATGTLRAEQQSFCRGRFRRSRTRAPLTGADSAVHYHVRERQLAQIRSVNRINEDGFVAGP